MNEMIGMLYVVRFVLCGVALGVFFVKLNIFSNYSTNCVFGIGFCSTSLFISLFDYICGLIIPGIPAFILVIFLPLLAITYIMIPSHRQIIFKIENEYKSFISEFRGKKYWKINSFEKVYKCIVLSGSCLLAIILFTYFIFACNRDLIESDRSHYELQARYFAETRDSISIDNYEDEKYGTVFKDDHGPLWPVYIADARMCSLEKSDYFNPLTIDMAYIMTVICWLGMITVTALIITGSIWSGLLAILLVGMYKYSFFYSIIGSRDAFRIIGILLLGLYVLEICLRLYKRNDVKEQIMKRKDSVAIIFFCYLCMQGHGGNAYVMLGLFIVFGCIALIKKMSLKELLRMAVCVLVGTVSGALKTIFMYLETGNLSSNSTLVFEGTKAAERYKQMGQEDALSTSASAAYEFADRIIVILGIVSIVYCMATLYIKLRDNEKNIYIIEIFSLLTIGMLLPVSGIMNFIGYNVSLYFIYQVRYRLYFLVLFSIVAAGVLTKLIRNNKKSGYVICGSTVLFILLSLNSTLSMYDSWNVEYYNSSVTASYKKYAEKIEEYAGNGNIYVMDQVFAYYFHKNPKLLYAPAARKLIIAKTEKEIERAIKEQNIKVIAFHPPEGWTFDFWLLPFYKYIQNDENAEHIVLETENGGELTIYVIK